MVLVKNKRFLCIMLTPVNEWNHLLLQTQIQEITEG